MAALYLMGNGSNSVNYTNNPSKKNIQNKKTQKINVSIKANKYISSYENDKKEKKEKNKKNRKFDQFRFTFDYTFYLDGVETDTIFVSNHYNIIDGRTFVVDLPKYKRIKKMNVLLITKKKRYIYDFGWQFEKIKDEMNFFFKNGDIYPIIKFNGKYAKERKNIYTGCILF